MILRSLLSAFSLGELGIHNLMYPFLEYFSSMCWLKRTHCCSLSSSGLFSLPYCMARRKISATRKTTEASGHLANRSPSARKKNLAKRKRMDSVLTRVLFSGSLPSGRTGLLSRTQRQSLRPQLYPAVAVWRWKCCRMCCIRTAMLR